jgi:hypothetical protein
MWCDGRAAERHDGQRGDQHRGAEAVDAAKMGMVGGA